MSDYLKQILMLLFGWSMGLFSPIIVDRIHRRYRRRELMQAVVDELSGLQFIMALVAWKHRVRNAEVTDDFLDRIVLPCAESYAGPDRDQGWIETLRRSRAMPENARKALHQSMRMPNQGMFLKQYGLPLILSQLTDLAICPLHFQRAVLHIRYNLDLFNQSVPLLQSLLERTFTELSSESRAEIEENLENGYRETGDRAELLVNAIARLKQQRYT